VFEQELLKIEEAFASNRFLFRRLLLLLESLLDGLGCLLVVRFIFLGTLLTLEGVFLLVVVPRALAVPRKV
jgi:hypothetical protein